MILFQDRGFPCSVWCIDGIHIRMKVPSDNEVGHVNRKGHHSINGQAICNHEGNYSVHACHANVCINFLMLQFV